MTHHQQLNKMKRMQYADTALLIFALYVAHAHTTYINNNAHSLNIFRGGDSQQNIRYLCRKLR